MFKISTQHVNVRVQKASLTPIGPQPEIIIGKPPGLKVWGWYLSSARNATRRRSKVRKTTITDMFLAAELAVRDIARAPERVSFGGLALLADSVFNDVRIVLGKDNWTAIQQLRKIQCGLTCASLSEGAAVRANCRP